MVIENYPELDWGKLGKIRLNKYIPVEPTAKQYAFLMLNSFLEIFYGGAGGGAKSYALFMGALQYVDQPEYNAIIFRESYEQLSLPGGLLDVAEHWLIPHPEVHYDRKSKLFTWPSGARLKFAYMQAEQDKFNYQSSEFHYIGFDEITGFTLSQYLFLFSRLRKSTGCNIPLRMRSASNPIGKGFEWVKDRFVSGKNKDIIFIPARLVDNPHIDRESYNKSLDHLDPITREKIKEGDWNVREESVMFKIQWFVVLPEYPIGIHDKIRMWDLAGTKENKDNNDPCYTAGALMGRLFDGRTCVFDIIRFRESPKGVEDTIKNTAIRDGKDVEIWFEEEPGSAGKSLIDNYARNVLRGWSVKSVSPTGSKVARASPLASAIERGSVVFCKEALKPAVLDEFLTFPLSKHNDCVDATAHGFNIMVSRPIPSTTNIYKNIYKESKKLVKS